MFISSLVALTSPDEAGEAGLGVTWPRVTGVARDWPGGLVDFLPELRET